ncbi:MAG: IS110 family transposase [Candidatus Aureabacteria bacterium]|nr:IS110 family transposase [Candidatus Auribacterota bacterium]
MEKHIMVGCDLHKDNMLIKIAEGLEKAEKKSFWNTEDGRKAMITYLKKRSDAAGGAKVVFAYEASFLGFGLYDDLTDAGFSCYVLAPTKIARSVKHRRRKTDERDAERILEIVRSHILAGGELPAIWIPDKQTRRDRELVRMRLGVGEKLATTKTQIDILLKRNRLEKPLSMGKNWTKTHEGWLGKAIGTDLDLSLGVRLAVESLLRQKKMLEEEILQLDKHIAALAQDRRYSEPVQELQKLKGVGLFTAMVYLTEMGDLSRFANRRQVGSFLGLVPSSHESGESDDRKGHITHQGPARIRKVLCQASWAITRTDAVEGAVYDRIVSRNPNHKKIAVVAIMRRLAIRMWHVGMLAQQRAGSFEKNTQAAAVA